MAELSYFVRQGAKSKLQAAGLTATEADALLERPEIQQMITDYRAGKPLPPAVANLSKSPTALTGFRALSKQTGMSFADVVTSSVFAPSTPTRNPIASAPIASAFAQGGPLWQNPNAPGVARGQALGAMSPAMSPEALSPYLANQGTESPFFSAIQRSEGTTDAAAQAAGYASGYDVPLGYGQYGQPPKPLTEMTLQEVLDFGTKVRQAPNNPHNSSAMGAFQIVGKTLKEFMGAAGLTLDDKFSPENQQKLAIEIAKVQGVDSGTWASFGLAKNAQNLAIAKASFPTATPGGGPAINWNNIGGVGAFPTGQPGLTDLASPEFLRDLALSGAITPMTPSVPSGVGATAAGLSPASGAIERATLSPISALRPTGISGAGVRPGGFTATPTQALGPNVAVNALGSNVGVSQLGPNATATPLSVSRGLGVTAKPTGALASSIARTLNPVAPIQIPTAQMPAQPPKPVSPFEAIRATTPTLQNLPALGPSQTLSALGPSQTLTPLSPTATLQALPPSVAAKPIGPTMLAASGPATLGASTATSPLAASSNPFAAVGAAAAGLSPARSPAAPPSVRPSTPSLGPAPISPSGRIVAPSRPVSVYSNTNPIGRAAAGFNGAYTGDFANREFMFPGQTGWTSAGIPTTFGRAMNVGQPSFGLQAAAASASNVANILGAQLSLALSVATYGGYGTNHRYAFRERVHEGAGGGALGGSTTGGLASRNFSTGGGGLTGATAGNLAAQRRAAVFGR